MADIAKHALIGVSVPGTAQANVLPDSVKLSPGLRKIVESAGAISPTAAMTLGAEPVIEFSTNKINLCNTIAALSGTGLILYFKAYDAATGLGTGNVSVTIGAGLIEPVKLSGKAGEKADLAVRVHAVSSDGTTVPVAVGTTAATLTANSDFWMLGAVTLGSALSGVRSFDLNFGYSVAKNTGEDGYVFPTQAYSEKQAATMAIRCRQLAAATQALINTGGAETTISAVFDQLDEGGVPDGTYTVTGQKGLVSIDEVAGGAPGEVGITVDLLASAWAGTSYLQYATVAPGA
jgi:hypothetical protein